jgi:hypothetical protein
MPLIQNNLSNCADEKSFTAVVISSARTDEIKKGVEISD